MIKKNLIFRLVLILFVFIILTSIFEISSLIIIQKRNFYLPLYLNKVQKIKEHIERIKRSKRFSFELGWDVKDYPNVHGYRGPAKDLTNAYISLFGDSFTEGFGNYEESWAYLLEKKLKKPVLNFGLGGYGTDQAYWLFEKRYIGKIRTPFVCLGILSENISRIMNRYQGFYVRKIKIGITKPMYYMEKNGEIVLLENPLNTPDDIELLGDDDFLKKIGAKDFWFNYYEKYDLNKKISFPYSYYLIKALPFLLTRYYDTRIMKRPSYTLLYNNNSAVQVMQYIIMKFINRAKENNTTPIILFFPTQVDMVNFKNDDKSVYNKFFLLIKSHYDATFNAMDYFSPYLKSGDNPSIFFGQNDHYNPYGERIVADGFYSDLIDLSSEVNKHRIKKE